MYKIFSVLFLFFVFASSVFSAVEKTPASVVASSLPDLKSVDCKFVQERNFSGTSVKSSGDFKFIKGKGVYFMTTYPVRATSSYTAANNRYINDIILAVTKKNFSKIDKDFDMFFQKSSKNSTWSVDLRAKNENIKNHIEMIKIFGDNKHITQILIYQVNPTVKTDIKFQFGV